VLSKNKGGRSMTAAPLAKVNALRSYIPKP
jgi:hypothetical protein